MANFPFNWIGNTDYAIGELNASVSAGDTSFTLKAGHGAKFPLADFVIKSEGEDVYCSTRTGNVLSGLTRGYNTTGAAAHPANAMVFQEAGRSSLRPLYDNVLWHTHPRADIPDFDHTHPQGDIVNLVSALAGKSATGHDHNGVYEPANANLQTHVASSHAPANAQANADITKGEIEAKLIGAITSHSHAGGSDPWTYVRLASDFPTTSATAVNVTGMDLAPTANLRYEIEGMFMLRTNTATVGPRPGIAWPTGMTDGVGRIDMTSSATARLLTNGNINAAMLCAVGGLPNNTQSYPAKIHVTLIAGASPGSTFRIQLASETAGTTVTMKANSWFRWRTF